jgi:hypothetical protein
MQAWLVETTMTKSGSTLYTEFWVIVMGMTKAYRVEGNMLVIAKHLLGRDTFETVKMAARARAHGRALSKGMCRVSDVAHALDEAAWCWYWRRGREQGQGKGKGTARGAVEVVEGDGDEEKLHSRSVRASPKRGFHSRERIF